MRVCEQGTIGNIMNTMWLPSGCQSDVTHWHSFTRPVRNFPRNITSVQPHNDNHTLWNSVAAVAVACSGRYSLCYSTKHNAEWKPFCCALTTGNFCTSHQALFSSSISMLPCTMLEMCSRTWTAPEITKVLTRIRNSTRIFF